jgi:hypothetical protein
VLAHKAQGREYAWRWPYAVERHPPHLGYQQMTMRQIPILALEPVKR